MFQGAGEVEDPEDGQTDDGPDYGAGRVVGEGVEADGPGKEMGAHDEDLEDGLSPAKDLLEDAGKGNVETKEADGAHGSANDLDGIAKVFDKGILFLELAEHETRVCGKEAHDENEGDAGAEAEGGDDGGEGEDSERHGFGDEDNAAFPAMCVSSWPRAIGEIVELSRRDAYHQDSVLKSISSPSLEVSTMLLSPELCAASTSDLENFCSRAGPSVWAAAGAMSCL